MSSRIEELALRRAMLQLRCAAQRHRLAKVTEELQHSLSYVDRGLELLRRLRSVPVLLGVALGAIVFFGPARLMRWTGQAVLLAAAVRRLTR